MRRILSLTALALVLLGAPGTPRAPRAGAQGTAHLSIALLRVEMVPLTVLGDSANDDLFVEANVQYTGADVFRLSTSDFRLIDSGNVAQHAASYDGANPLQSTEFTGSGSTKGWLLFKVKVSVRTRTLSLGYIQTVSMPSGTQQPMLLGQSKPFSLGMPDPRRLYAANAQLALQTYLLDEAQAAGYIRENVAPLYASGAGSAIPAGVRARIAAFRRTLAGDRRAFDAVPSVSAARGLKAQSDTAFAAIDRDLIALLSLHRTSDWLAWSTLFTTDDLALADLYQNWPGPQ